MSEQLRESLSALMDGESEELELRRILAHKDKDLVNRTWADFHRSQQAIDGHSNEFMGWDVSARVSAALADESLPMSDSDTAHGGSEKAQPFWLKPLAGMAVAASVMVAVVVGVQSLNPVQTGASSAQPALAGRVYPHKWPLGQAVVLPSVRSCSRGLVLPGAQAAADLATQQRLEKFMLLHTEHAALNSGKGLMPYARVASFEVE